MMMMIIIIIIITIILINKTKVAVGAYLKNDKSIVIKSANKGSAVVVWDRDDYIKEAQKRLGNEKSMKKLLTTLHLF